MSTRHPLSRGYTLVELVIALGISMVVIAGSLMLLNAQQRSFQGGTADRALQEAGRVALEELTGHLRLAGYGMDPGMAFDFGQALSPQLQAPLPEGVPTLEFGGYACGAAVTCRDRIDAPDEVVFHHRDPGFAHRLADHTETSLTLKGPLPRPIEAGQILQVVCGDGDMVWAYVTVDARVAASDAATVAVGLTAGQAAADTSPIFPFQNQLLANECFATSATVLSIERFRYYVETYLPDGTVTAWGDAAGRPYLMLDKGFVDAAGAPKVSMVAPDVEDLQFAYVYPMAAPGTQLRGATVGTQLTNAGTGIELAPGSTPSIPTYATPALDASRATGHPSNIRAVRVAVVVRQPDADSTIFEPDLPALGNRDALVRESHRRRAVFETTVALPNMESRAPLFPTFGDPAIVAEANLNFGGG